MIAKAPRAYAPDAFFAVCARQKIFVEFLAECANESAEPNGDASPAENGQASLWPN